MKPYLYSILAALMFCAVPNTGFAEPETDSKVVYVIPVKGPIERGLLYVLRRGLTQAEREGAGTIIFHMDTPGGSVAVCEEIVRLLIDLPENVKTITYVDKDALSAGALIAVATDEIYMAPGSRIGASAMISILGDIPEGDMKEKHVSSMEALILSAARRNGHDEELVRAMIRRDVEYSIGKEILCPKGQLLTLSDIDAIRPVPGKEGKTLLAKEIVKSIDDLYGILKVENQKKITLEQTWSEDVARWIEWLSVLLLVGGLLCIYIEFKTPGFGVFGITGIILLAIFFWGHNVAGLAGMEEILIFALGVILLLAEIFFIAGFGIAGISGITLIIISLLMAMMRSNPGLPWYIPPVGHFQKAVVTLGGAIFIFMALLPLISRFLPKTRAFQRLSLPVTLASSEGYMSSKTTSDLVGLKGKAETELHPSGIGVFGEKRINIVTRGDFIEKDTPIVIAETHGNRIVVEACSDKNTEG